MLEQHYSVKELARLLSMGQRTIWKWVKEGKLNAVKVGAVVRIPASELARLGFRLKDEDSGDEKSA
jgi:acetyl-CoA synthetase